MKTRAELFSMTEDELHAYFNEQARYYREMPGGPKYGIRINGTTLLDEDTFELWKEFFRLAKIKIP